MRTLVVVGSSRTRVQAGRMVTPRDYRWAQPGHSGDPGRHGGLPWLRRVPAHLPRARDPAGGPGPLVVLGDVCTECGECVEICPADAIEWW